MVESPVITLCKNLLVMSCFLSMYSAPLYGAEGNSKKVFPLGHLSKMTKRKPDSKKKKSQQKITQYLTSLQKKIDTAQATGNVAELTSLERALVKKMQTKRKTITDEQFSAYIALYGSLQGTPLLAAFKKAYASTDQTGIKHLTKAATIFNKVPGLLSQSQQLGLEVMQVDYQDDGFVKIDLVGHDTPSASTSSLSASPSVPAVSYNDHSEDYVSDDDTVKEF